MGAIQYPLTLATTSFLPKALDVSQRDVYLGTVVATSVVGFAVLRSAIFHPSGDATTGPHVGV